jgi:TP901 family phage tail tape measure protein
MAVDTEAKIIVSAVDKYSSTFGDLNSGFGTVAKTALAAEVAVACFSVTMAALTVKMGSEAVRAAADFHDAIFDITAVTGPAGASTQQISDILDGLVQKFPVTGAQAGKALESIAQFGFGAEKQLKNISDAAIGLQIATGTDLNTTVSALTATLNQFGLEAQETARVSNILAAAQFNSAASVSDLKEALKFAGPTAKLFDKDLESTVGVLSLFRDAGLSASQAGTVFRGALVALAKGTRDGEDALKNYGLTLEDLNPQTKSYTEIIEAFKGQTISGADAVKIFGTEAASFADIINKGTGVLESRIAQVTATSAAEDAAAQKSQKWSVVLDNLGGTLDVFKKTIGENLLPILIEFIGKDEKSGIRGIIDQLLKFEKESQGIGGPLVKAFEALQAAIDEVFQGEFQGDVENVYKWLVNISEALGKNVENIIDFGQKFAEWFVQITKSSENLGFALDVVEQSIYGIGILLAGGALLKGVTTITALTKGISGLAKNKESVFKVFFKGKGSSERDLSEKINEMDKLLDSFVRDIEKKHKFDADFGPIRKSIDNAHKQTVGFRGAINKAGAAMSVIGEITASAGIGYAIGTWINQMKLFGDGTVSVGEKIVNVVSSITGLSDEIKSTNEKVLSGLSKFADFELPSDFLDSGVQKLGEYEKSLKGQRDFLFAYIKQQKILFDEGAISLVTYNRYVEESETKIKSLNQSLNEINASQLSDNLLSANEEIDESNRQTVENAKQYINDLIEFEKAGVLNRGKVYEEVNEQIVQSEENSSDRIISERRRTSEETIKLEQEKINEAKKLLEEGVIDVEEFEERKTDAIKSSNEEQIKIAKENVEKTRAFFAQEISELESIGEQRTDLESKILDEIYNKIKEQQDKVNALEQEAENDRKKILETRIDTIKSILEEEEQLFVESISKINLAEAEGTKGSEEAIKEKLKLEEEFLQKKLDLTEETYNNIKEVYPEDVKKQKEAYGAMKDAQLEFTDFKIDKIAQERDALQESLDSEIGIYQANAEIKKLEIEKQENAGVISAQDAIEQKKAIEEEFLNFSIQKLQEKSEIALAAYGKDSEEYVNAVLAKTQAETELSQVQSQTAETTKEVTEATKEQGQATSVSAAFNAAFNDRLVASKGHLNEFLGELEGTRKALQQLGGGAFELVQIDATTQSLRDLGNIAANAEAALSSLSDNRFEAIARSEVNEDLAIIEQLETQFNAITRTAGEAGLQVNVMDQTLEEAATDVEARIEGWTEFSNTIGEISKNASLLTEEYSNLNSNLESESILDVAKNFENVSDSAKDLSAQISEVNREFGIGSIEAAEEMADGVIEAYEDIYDDAKDILNDLKSEWESLADEIIKTNEKISDVQQSTEEKIREARRETMDELGQFQDVRLEYDEVYAEANKQLAQGQAEKAIELFEKAADLAEELQQEVQDGSGNVVKSLEENTDLSIELMQKASDAAISALEGHSTSLYNQQTEIQGQIEQTTNTISDLGSQMNESFGGINQATSDINNLGSAIRDLGGNFNLDFTGTGSSKRPLGDKIQEMTGKVSRFSHEASNEMPVVNSDFSSITQGVEKAKRSLGSLSDVDLNISSTSDIRRSGLRSSLGRSSSSMDFSELIDSQQGLTVAIQEFSFPDQFSFNVTVNSNGEDWLRGLTKSIIDQIFVEASAEEFRAFGQEG